MELDERKRAADREQRLHRMRELTDRPTPLTLAERDELHRTLSVVQADLIFDLCEEAALSRRRDLSLAAAILILLVGMFLL